MGNSHGRVATILKDYVRKEPEKKTEIPEPSGIQAVKGIGLPPKMDDRNADKVNAYAASVLQKIKESAI